MNILSEKNLTITSETVVERARLLVPGLRARQAETDLLARASNQTIAELEAAGLFSMSIPRAYGGLQTSISTWKDAVMEIGRGDGGVAWAITLINACNWMAAGFFPKSVTDEVFAKPNTRVAGVFSARGVTARRVSGGIIVEKGMWFFNSGVYHAHWDLLGVPMFNEAGENIGPGIALVPMSDVKILNDWDTIGLRGSGSSNVSMENVFIPDERIVGLRASTEGRQDGAFQDQPLYRTAFTPLMVAILAFPLLGMGTQMMEEFLETLPRRDIKLTPYTKQGEAAVTHIQIGQLSAKIHAAKQVMAKACSDMDAWATKSEYMPILDRASICRDTAASDQLMWEAAEIISQAAGGTFARRGYVLSRVWGDMKVATQHPFVSLMSNFEMYGRHVCGVNPPLMPV
ncbi:acyl-CoA dehydrogenase family protein [Glaciimonas sp. PAMC28666]|uniref:acyl-CoA dehydrogenase family protein n=1 Tax=Glaciimonas sp. PAMC28666 TaxID=2807626 RepID=UPI001963F909|nr:acyl-CoA dehydrogenase family protein [Glaciimonas sp. PAMC28666]QRX81746.1 acyl-CoA dehydrogenase family protein [Glaciimonas sp. PAMC28666]